MRCGWDGGGYTGCQCCILYSCSWQRQRPGCTGAAEQIGCVCTHTQSSRENPPRQKTREGRPQCMHDHVQARALPQDGCTVMPSSHGALGLLHYTRQPRCSHRSKALLELTRDQHTSQSTSPRCSSPPPAPTVPSIHSPHSNALTTARVFLGSPQLSFQQPESHRAACDL